MHVLGEQEGPFLRAGRTKVNGFARKGAEIFKFTVGICALDPGDTLGVVAAENELLHHLRDALDAESAVDEGVFAFVLFRDALKMLFKQDLEGIDAARPVHLLGDRCDRKG